MAQIFLKIANMSISASWIVLAVLVLRLLLKKAPKWINSILWGIVGLRLIMPFSFESILSLIPSSETISPEIMMDKIPEINTGVPIINDVVNPVISESFAPSLDASANPLQIWIPIISIIWLLGIIAMLIYAVISYFRVNKKIDTAVLWSENIFQSEKVVSPFVLGVIKPKIYLPFSIDEQDMKYVIAHENAHILRKDHLWKPIGFLILTLHWFNPLMWLSYVLLCRDIELACDEKVIKELDNQQKADYSQALLTCSVNRRMIAACPLAFGEVSVKDRVKSVLHYKKPAFWIIAIAVVASIVSAICFLTNPINSNKTEKLLDVLNNERKFITTSGEAVYLKDYKPFNRINSVPDKYALVDLDGDNKKELIVHITWNGGAYIVFHIDSNKIYGFDFWERELIDLKEDGTFIQSGGAGLNSFAALKFERDKCNIIEQAYADDTANEYRINGASSEAEVVNEYIEEFYSKPSVSWKEYDIVLRTSNTSFKNLKITVELDTEQQSVAALIIVDEKTDKKIQHIKLNENQIFSNEIIYIKDINFDGEDDLVIPYQRSAAAAYFIAYVWDAETRQYVYAPTFENLSNVALDTSQKVILSSRSSDRTTSYAISVYDESIKDFKVQKTLVYYPDDNEKNMIYEEENLKNGKMQIVKKFIKPLTSYYSMDSEVANYYNNHTEWRLSSSKWKNYLVSPEETVINTNQNQYNALLYMQFLKGENTAIDSNGTKRKIDTYFLDGKLDEDYRYTFYDMTGDGVPELCIDKSPEMYFFTVNGNEVYHWYTETKSYSKLLNNGAFLFERHGAAPEHINYEYYELDENANIKFLVTFSWWDSNTFKGEEYSDFYEINGKEVSKAEYQEKTKKYLDIGSDKIVWYDSAGNIKQ